MVAVSGTVYDSAGLPVAGRVVRAYRRDTGVLLGAMTSSDGSPPVGDPFYSDVALLLRADGADGALVVDESPTPQTIVTNGTAKISTAQSQYGGSSIVFNNSTGSFLQCGAAANFDWLTRTLESWTIAGWVRVPNITGTKCILSKGTNNFTLASVLFNISGSSLVISAYKSTVFGGLGASATGIVANTQVHVLATYDAATRALRCAVNGVFGAPQTLEAETEYAAANAQTLNVGRYSDAFSPFDGHIDDLEITRGQVRYAADFSGALPGPNLTFPLGPVLAAGGYLIDLAGHSGEVNVVALDDALGDVENDRILRTTGV